MGGMKVSNMDFIKLLPAFMQDDEAAIALSEGHQVAIGGRVIDPEVRKRQARHAHADDLPGAQVSVERHGAVEILLEGVLEHGALLWA